MSLNNFVFLLFVGFIFVNSFCEALSPGEEGVCVVKISSPRTRMRYFNVITNKYCGKKKCVVKKAKKESYSASVNQTVCCNGYEYNSGSEKCTPKCSTGCDGGVCIAPDVCHCALPAILDPKHPNKCVAPSCEQTCVNAECIGGKCQCATGFRNFNASHCFLDCGDGFSYSDGKCTPKCDEPCQHGVCTAPNSCTCNAGYKANGTFTCEPICEPCGNSVCASPNNCSCFDGYKKLSETQCVPICDECQNGDCIAPDNCQCRPGFIMDNGCQPTCEQKCVNAVCTGPNECSCAEGFVKNGTLAHVCHKPCAACNATCLDGECLDENCRKPKIS